MILIQPTDLSADVCRCVCRWTCVVEGLAFPRVCLLMEMNLLPQSSLLPHVTKTKIGNNIGHETGTPPLKRNQPNPPTKALWIKPNLQRACVYRLLPPRAPRHQKYLGEGGDQRKSRIPGYLVNSAAEVGIKRSVKNVWNTKKKTSFDPCLINTFTLPRRPLPRPAYDPIPIPELDERWNNPSAQSRYGKST